MTNTGDSNSCCRRLEADELGTIDIIGYLLLVTLVSIGMLVGVNTFRMGLLQEFGDVGAALERLDQSFTLTITVPLAGTTETFSYTDTVGPNDTAAGSAPPGITITLPVTADSGGTDEEGQGAFNTGTAEGTDPSTL